MTLLNAIVEVLSTVQKPLHVTEIYKEIMDRQLWHTTGKTPTATIGARLYSDIKKHGDASQFVKVSPNVFAMRDIDSDDDNEHTQELENGTGENQTSELDSVAQDTLKPNTSNSSLSFTDCAQKVLEKYGSKKPMHYKDITSRALDTGWLKTKGKTPDATMYAVVITEIKRHQNRGQIPRFVQHGSGYIGLSRWAARGLAFQIQQQNDKVQQALHKRLMSMSPLEFEEFISQLLPEMGFENVEVTKHHADGGIDVRGVLVVDDVVRIKMAVQVKRWKNNVQAPIVQQVRGSLNAHEQGLIITTSDFGKGARNEAAQTDKTPIALMNGKQLVLLLMEHGIGIHRLTPSIFEIKEEPLTLGKDEEK